MLLFTPSSLPPSPHLRPLPSTFQTSKVEAGICHVYLNLHQRHYVSHLIPFLSLSLTLSVFISHSPLRFLSSFFYLPVVESLPNEVADGSILQRDRVERSPTLKSINLTVSISVQTSLSCESKRSVLA